MKLKEAIDVLMKVSEQWEALEKEMAEQSKPPPTMDELADRLWGGDFDDEFASKQEFKDYMHRLLKSDLFAKERMGK